MGKHRSRVTEKEKAQVKEESSWTRIVVVKVKISEYIYPKYTQGIGDGLYVKGRREVIFQLEKPDRSQDHLLSKEDVWGALMGRKLVKLMVEGYLTSSPYIPLSSIVMKLNCHSFLIAFPMQKRHDLFIALILLDIVVHISQDEICDSSLNIKRTIIWKKDWNDFEWPQRGE